MESKSLKIILDEIDKRIGGLKVQVDKIRSESLDKLQKEFHSNLYYLTLDDIINSTTTTKNKLIEIIGFERKDFNLNSDEGLQDLLKKVNDYIELNNRRVKSAESDINKYEYYKDFFSSINKKHDLFTDVSGLRMFVDSLGLNNNEKIAVEKYLADYNVKARVLDPEISETVTYIYNEANSYEDVKEAIKEYITNNKIKVDLNLLKSYAADIANEFNKTSEVVENVLIGMILGQEFKKYINSSNEDSIEHLSRIHRVLQNYTFDDMRSVISEANRIFNLEMMNLSNKSYEFEEIVVTDATTAEEFEELKNKKKTMIAYLLKNKVQDYENNANYELKNKYKELITGLINEYHNTDLLSYKEADVKVR